ncbi:MAG TPA: carboxylating nicotinate-nucleotide diphosphorylase [Ignavibacteria bacterium]|nr:carboxylating nicotinate-nucleotide diphosphorylase [Ignavibacteria bacterium]
MAAEKNLNIEIDKLILSALNEDIKSGDITSENLISNKKISEAVLLLKEDAVISGLEIFKRVFTLLDKKIKIVYYSKDANFYKKGKILAKITGNTINLLKGERTALNIIQRMSGIATNVYISKKLLDNNKTKILDTRKTTPNFRLFEKLAVKHGGGDNHRFGLYDMILIKDNHIEAAGGIKNVISKLPEIRNKTKCEVELEVKNMKELKIALDYGIGLIDRIMLDNFKIENVKKAIKLINKKFKIEISGGINQKNISKYSKIQGIDFISSGSLTHSSKSIDIAFDFLS